MNQKQQDQNSDRGLETKTEPEPSKWGNIPWDKFDEWHIDSLIEEMADIRKDIGMYKRLLKNQFTNQTAIGILKDLIKIDQQRLYLIKAEIENERFGKA